MKILLISKDERNAFLLQRIQDEGHEAKLLSRQVMGVWDGPMAKSPKDALDWGPDIILVDGTGFGDLVQWFRDRDIPVVGGTSFADKLAKEYSTSLLFLEASKVTIPEYYDVETAEGIDDYLRATDRPWRVVGGDRHFRAFDDMARLEAFLESNPEYKNFVMVPDLQLPGTTQFRLGGFINRRGLMNPAFRVVSVEGPLEGVSEGVTLKRLASGHPVVQATLGKVADRLYSMGYQGTVFVDCHAAIEDPEMDDNEVVVSDLTLNPPDGFWASLLRGLEMPVHFFLDRLVNPRRPDTPWEFSSQFVSSCKLSMPPYPMVEADWVTPEQRKTLLQMMPKAKFYADSHIYWNGVSRTKDGMLKPLAPILGYLTGKGESSEESWVEIQGAKRDLKSPYAQIFGYGTNFSNDDLPTWIAKRQLEEVA